VAESHIVVECQARKAVTKAIAVSLVFNSPVRVRIEIEVSFQVVAC